MKKVIAVSLIFIIVFFYFNMIFVNPLKKKVLQAKGEYSNWKAKVESRQAKTISSDTLASLEGKVEEYSPAIDKMLLNQEENVLKETSLDSWKKEISFNDISSLASKEEEHYFKESLSCKVRAELTPLLEFLYWLENQDKFVSIDKIKMENLEGDKSLIAAEFIFSAYRAKEKIPKGFFFSERDIKEVFSLPERDIAPPDSMSIVSANPFLVPYDVEAPSVDITPATAYPQGLNLQGITIIDDKKMALINGQLFREGHKIKRYTVIKIENRRVKLKRENLEFFIEVK